MLAALASRFHLNRDDLQGSPVGIISQIHQAVVEDQRVSGSGLYEHQPAVLDYEAGVRLSDPVASSRGGPAQAHIPRIPLLSDKRLGPALADAR